MIQEEVSSEGCGAAEGRERTVPTVMAKSYPSHPCPGCASVSSAVKMP